MSRPLAHSLKLRLIGSAFRASVSRFPIEMRGRAETKTPF